MGGKGSGPRADPAKRRLMARLRRRGLTLEAIARQVGLSREGVRVALRKMGVAPPSAEARCPGCNRVVLRGAEALRHVRPPWCLPCLRKHPEATVADRIRSRRCAAGLTQRQLAEQSGLNRKTVERVEREQPIRAGTLAQLAAVLGAELLAEPMP